MSTKRVPQFIRKFQLLAALALWSAAGMDGPPTISGIARLVPGRSFDYLRVAFHRILPKLEEDGLVRTSGGKGRRGRTISLTPRGLCHLLYGLKSPWGQYIVARYLETTSFGKGAIYLLAGCHAPVFYYFYKGAVDSAAVEVVDDTGTAILTGAFRQKPGLVELVIEKEVEPRALLNRMASLIDEEFKEAEPCFYTDNLEDLLREFVDTLGDRCDLFSYTEILEILEENMSPTLVRIVESRLADKFIFYAALVNVLLQDERILNATCREYDCYKLLSGLKDVAAKALNNLQRQEF